MVKNGCYIPSTSGNRNDRQTDRPTGQLGWTTARWAWMADGYMRNYGLAHFQREAKKKPPLCDDTHLADEPEKETEPEREKESPKPA